MKRLGRLIYDARFSYGLSSSQHIEKNFPLASCHRNLIFVDLFHAIEVICDINFEGHVIKLFHGSLFIICSVITAIMQS